MLNGPVSVVSINIIEAENPNKDDGNGVLNQATHTESTQQDEMKRQKQEYNAILLLGYL